MTLSRRHFLKVLGTAGAGMAASQLPLMRAVAAAPAAGDEFFIFIHASGGWDVTLWSDPRNERRGLVEPASTDNTDITALHHWKSTALDSDTNTFHLLVPSSNSPLVFGPGIGNLIDGRDSICLLHDLEK